MNFGISIFCNFSDDRGKMQIFCSGETGIKNMILIKMHRKHNK